MYSIAGHELVDTGSHYDSEYWGYTFAVRCLECPIDPAHEVIVHLGEEEDDPRSYRVDYRAMLTAVARHVGPAASFTPDDVDAGVLLCELDHELGWRHGLRLLAQLSRERDQPQDVDTRDFDG